MRQRKKYIPLLAISLVLFGVIDFIIFLINPLRNFQILSFEFSPIPIFFLILFFGIFFFFSFLFLNKRRGLLTSLFITLSLLLRFLDFKNIFYTLLIFLILLLIELYFSTNKKNTDTKNPIPSNKK